MKNSTISITRDVLATVLLVVLVVSIGFSGNEAVATLANQHIETPVLL